MADDRGMPGHTGEEMALRMAKDTETPGGSAPTPKQREEREDTEWVFLWDVIRAGCHTHHAVAGDIDRCAKCDHNIRHPIHSPARVYEILQALRTHSPEEPPLGEEACAGCRRPFGPDRREVYRCVECSLPFHQPCAKIHFRDTSHDSPEEPVDVVAAVRRDDDGMVWLCKRNSDGDNAGLAGMWEYPGGKVEDGEQLREALVREILEEFPGCIVNVGRVLDSVTSVYEGTAYRVTFFEVTMSQVTAHPTHEKVGWFTPDEACALDHLPSGTVFNARHLASPEEPMGRPEIVCLCGSTRFKDAYIEANKRLTLAGKIVLSVGMFGHADNEALTTEQKRHLDTLHLRKIDVADRVLILNVDGYVGESTSREIEYANANGKPVDYLHPIGQPLDGGEEQ